MGHYLAMGFFVAGGLRLKDLIPASPRHRNRRQSMRSGGRHLDARRKTSMSRLSGDGCLDVLHLERKIVGDGPGCQGRFG